MSARIPQLLADAALASRWPTLHVFAPGEADVEQALARLITVVGPVEQADTFEPADPADPWELRVDLPDLTADLWDQLQAVLVGFSPSLRPGLSPGAREAVDLGVLIPEDVGGGVVIASMWVDAEEGGVRHLERIRARAKADDADLAELAGELLDAVRAVDPRISLQSDRGPDTVQPFVHPASGRFGVETFLAGTGWEDRPGDEVYALRERVIGAIGGVIAARADARVRLAPDLGWEAGFGMNVVMWLIGPATGAWPGDGDLADRPPDFDPLAPGLAAVVEHVELQVVPIGGHLDLARAVGELAGRAVVPMSGARPRWVRHRGRLLFAPTWTAPVVGGIDDLLDQLRNLDVVAAARAVPAAPYGFPDWAFAEPCWRAGSQRWLLRVRDGRRDRDALPRTVVRDRTARDEILDEVLTGALTFATPAAWSAPQAVVDSAGRQGVELRLPADVRGEDGLAAVVEILGGLDLAGLVGVVTHGWRRGEPIAQLWWDDDPDRPPIWA